MVAAAPPIVAAPHLVKRLLQGSVVQWCPKPNAGADHAMQTSHHAALETKHAGIDRRIEEELHRPMPDSTLIATLKKQKLKLKEELASI
jgi:hypothetical protein